MDIREGFADPGNLFFACQEPDPDHLLRPVSIKDSFRAEFDPASLVGGKMKILFQVKV